MRVLVFPPGRDWATRRAAAIEAERAGFDGVLVADHLSMYGVAHLEAISMMGALAAATRTIPLVFGVLSATFRAPALVARAVLTLHDISGGRVQAGLGAGVDEEEHRAAGIRYGTPRAGDRALEIVARHADEWNCGAVYLDRAAERVARIRTLIAAREKPLRLGLKMPIVLRPPRDPAAAKRYNLDLALHGDLDAMTERLKEIRAMGFDTIWLGANASSDAFERAGALLPRAKQL